MQVLIEGPSKKGNGLLSGRTDGFQTVRVPEVPIPACGDASHSAAHHRLPKAGDFVAVDVHQADDGSLRGQPVAVATLPQFVASRSDPTLLLQGSLHAQEHALLRPETLSAPTHAVV